MMVVIAPWGIGLARGRPYFGVSPEAEKERPYPPYLLTIVDRPVDYSR